MDLRDYLDILRARWKLITVTTLLGVMAAAVASMLATPLYQSCTVRFVSASDGQASLGNAYTGSLFTQGRVKSYLDAVTSTPVMQAVVEDLNVALTPGQVAAKVDVNNPLDTVNLEICATDANPEQAQRIATATATQFANFVQSIELPNDDGTTLIQITELESASLPTTPVSPRTKINIALGFLVGLAIGVGAAVLLETLDTRIKSIETLTKYFDQPLLGVIGFDPDAAKHPLIRRDAASSKRAESFRQVRTNLQFVDIDHRPRSIVVTSAIPREGKSTTAINLSLTIAQTGQPVFLIEGDLRRPKVAEYLGIEGGAGLTDVLVGRATLDEVMQPWGTTGNMWVLPAGPLPPNPSELLGSQSMADLLHHLEKRATIIIDAPPLLPVTDAAVLSQLAGGAILVIATGKTRREQLRTAESSIESVGGKILGLVLNMAPAKGPDSQRYGYGYSYDYNTVGASGKTDEHPPVIPAGLGGMPGVNGSDTPVMPVGPVPGRKPSTPPAPAKAPSPSPERSEAKASATELTVPVAKQPAKSPSPPTPAANPAAKPSVKSAASSEADSRVRTADSPSDVVDRALGRNGPRAAPLEQVVPTNDKVIGHSVKVPLPEPVVDDPIVPFEPDPVPVGEWSPPKPRPAFDPLTAPIDQIPTDDH